MLKKINKFVMFIAYIALFALCIFLFIVSYSKADDLIDVTGTPIRMKPPHGFVLSSDFSGFFNKDKNASIVVAVFPDDVASKISNIFTDQNKFTKAMAPLGFAVQKVVELERESSQVPLIIYSGIQTLDKQRYNKWATLIANGGIYMITIQVPEEMALSQQEVEAAFQSVHFNRHFTLDNQIEHLPFSFVSAAPFYVTATILGNGIHLGMKDEKGNSGDVSIFILRDLQSLDGDNPILAQNLYIASIMPAFKLQNTVIEREEQFLYRNGRLLVGSGITPKGEEQDIILYSAIDDNRHAVYLQALAPKGKLNKYQSIIKNIADSVNLKH